MKKLINVLWEIEKDLSVIASNTEAQNKKILVKANGEVISQRRS
ncbi:MULTISPECIES: hypothetical protein [Levilactobacillus]|nr:hypothetical protein [Levilactobacillus brevis]